MSGRTPREKISRYGIDEVRCRVIRHGSIASPSGVLAPGHDTDRLDRRDLDPAQVAQQPVLAPGDRLAGLLDGVHLVLEPHEPHDVAGDAAGQRRP